MLAQSAAHEAGAESDTAARESQSHMIVIVAPGYEATPPDVAALIAAMEAKGAALAIASPFAHGGRLRDNSWLARTATAWSNGFLSLAAHGELATVVGTIRVMREEALASVRESAPGIYPDAEITLEARRQGFRIIEVPMELERHAPANRFSFASLWGATVRCWNRVRCGLFYRPALWLALPGLVPGVLPLVVAIVLLVHATPAQIALWTAVTLVVQYGSLAIFSWQAGTFAFKRWGRR